MKPATRLVVVTLLQAATVAVAGAQNASPSPRQQAEEAIRFRQADMDMQAYSLAPVLPMLQGTRFDAALALRSASRLAVMLEMLPDVFQSDTSHFAIKTGARPEIWTNALAFELKIHDMEKAVADMASSAMAADEPATLKASRAVVDACRSCHQQFAVGLK